MLRVKHPLVMSSIVSCCVIAITATSHAQVPARTASSIVNRSTAADSHPMDPALKLLQQSLTHMQQNVNDYTALFVKRIRIAGELSEPQFANMKVINRKTRDGQLTSPFSVYLKFLKPDVVAGREVIWVENANNGNLVAHETGIGSLLNVNLDPRGMIAMRGERYPITEIGIENLAAQIIQLGSKERAYGECEVNFFRGAKVGERKCLMCQVTHPVKRDHFEFYQARVYLDEELKVPIRYERWLWPTEPGGKPALDEEFTYLNLKVNVGLTAEDFSTKNPEYGFR